MDVNTDAGASRHKLQPFSYEGIGPLASLAGHTVSADHPIAPWADTV